MKTIAAALAVAGLALAGCGGSGYGGGSNSNSGGSSSAAASNSTAPTLYTFSKDTAGKSNCSGACAKNWPPAASAPGLDSGKITKIKRADGSSQVALDSHPLYRFIGDKKPGDAKGDGLNAFGGLWKTAGSSSSSSATPPPSRSGY
jgi:predicted lipoprotein with Yx(FWY)xxD motif